MSDINLPSSPSGGDTYTFNNITYTYDGEKWTAQAPLSTTGTYGNANVASYVSSQGLIDLTDISVATATPSGNGSLSYSNVSGVFTFTPADASGSGGGANTMAGLSDVDSVDTVATGDVLLYDGSEYGFVNLESEINTRANALIATSNIENLNNVDGVDTVANGDTLVYDSSSGHFGYVNLGSEIQGYNQSLSLNSTAGQLSITGGSNVDLRQTQFLYSATSDLPSASTYHGAIAHVHAEGALYFAHGGNWVKLANDSTAVNSSSEVTFTRDVHFQRGVEERFGSLSGQSGTVTHNLNDGHVFYHTTPAGDFTANFTNFNLDDGYTTSITIIVNQGVTARVVSAVQIEGSAQTIEWQGGSAPTGTANGLDAFSFTILRNGSSYIVLGQMVDFA